MTKLRLLALAVAMILSVAACSSSNDSSGGDAWSYKSGDGKTYTAQEVPVRIIAQGEAAAALLSYGIKPVGIYLSESVEENRSLEGFDLDGIEILGEEWGKIDAEKAAELAPDLIVAAYWPVEEGYGGLEEGADAESKKIAELATVVGPTAGESVETMLNGFEELAMSLGADVDTGDGAKEKAAYEAAKEQFKAAVAANPGLTTMAVSPADDLLYVAVPEHSAELTDFVQWGLDVIVPDSPDPAFPYWENLSWENADKYQPDLILFDDRTYESSMASAQKQPTWTSINAAAVGAVTPWPAYWVSTFADYAEQLQKLTDAIDAADPNLT